MEQDVLIRQDSIASLNITVTKLKECQQNLIKENKGNQNKLFLAVASKTPEIQYLLSQTSSSA